MTAPLEAVIEGCFFALRLGLRISPMPTGNLKVDDDMYFLGGGNSYHPLEAALVGTARSGDWRADVATLLGVDSGWVDGFLHGFAQGPEVSTDPEYLQGYLTAEQLRTTRFRQQ